jgi:hypothetical protein
LSEALERERATGAILRVIASSPTTVDPVFDAILDSALRLCASPVGGPELGAGKHTIVFDFKSDGPGLGGRGRGPCLARSAEHSHGVVSPTHPARSREALGAPLLIVGRIPRF